MLQQQKKSEKLANDGLTTCIIFIMVIKSGKMALTFIKEGNFESFKRGWKARGSIPGKNKRHYLKKSPITFVISVCPSVSVRLPLDGFP
jgi:hypothetical protein